MACYLYCSSRRLSPCSACRYAKLWLFHFCGLRFGVYYAQITTKQWSLP